MKIHHASDVVGGVAIGLVLGGWPSRLWPAPTGAHPLSGSGKRSGAAEGLGAHMTRAFAVTFDYRCPFARNAHEHLLAGLAGGADWDVTFVPFSLGQVHVGRGRARRLGPTPTTTPACWPSRPASSSATASPSGSPPSTGRCSRSATTTAATSATPTPSRDPGRAPGVDDVGSVVEAVDVGRGPRSRPQGARGGGRRPRRLGRAHFIAGDDRAVFVRLMDRNRRRGDRRAARRHGVAHRSSAILDLLEWHRRSTSSRRHLASPR